MNKSELLADLASRVITMVGDPELPVDAGVVKTYQQVVISMAGINQFAEQRVTFTVVNEGTAGEVAGYRGKPPVSADDYNKVFTYLQGLVVANVIDGFQAETIRGDLGPNSFAIVKAWEDDGNGGLLEKQLRIASDANGDAYHKVIVG